MVRAVIRILYLSLPGVLDLLFEYALQSSEVLDSPGWQVDLELISPLTYT